MSAGNPQMRPNRLLWVCWKEQFHCYTLSV